MALSHIEQDIKPLGHAPGVRLQRGVAMTGAAVVMALVFNAANLPAPLYVIYRDEFGFSQITLTLVYAVYVIGSLTAMSVFGRLSDQIGRRPVLFLSIALAAVTAVLFLFTFNTPTLFAARALAGLAIGLAATACTAWIAELEPRHDRATAAIVTVAANLTGLGLGPLIAGVLADVAPWPLRLPYAVYLIGLLAPAYAVWTVHETVTDKKPLRDVSLKPHIGVPQEIALQFVAPAVTAFVMFALMGFYSSLIPTLLEKSLKIDSHAVGGAVSFFLFVVGALSLIPTQRISSRAAMLLGLVLLIPGVVLLVLAQHFASMALMLATSAIGGAAGAHGYRGSVQVINEIAPKDRRAEIVSSYLVCCYVGISVPVIGIGMISSWAGPEIADALFAALLIVLSLVAIFMGWKYGQRQK